MNINLKALITKFQHNRKLKYSIIVLCSLVVVIAIVFFCLITRKTINQAEQEVFIYPKDDFSKVTYALKQQNIISQKSISFKFACKLFSYPQHIKAGRYVVKPHTNIFTLIKTLRSGNQTPIKIVVNSCRTEEDFCRNISQQLLMSDTSLHSQIMKSHLKYNNQIFYDIIPNTYEVYWTIKPESLMKKLKKESDNFWKTNENLLQSIHLTKEQVIVLASIVNEETNKDSEKNIIAGVYINRLKKNMLLQADPTVKFAYGDFSIRRITAKHLQVDSPFNTYKQKGLPPAPICLPMLSSINSVLKYKPHNYLYFCAKEDFSGYHNFATTLQEHYANAKLYRQALNARGIK